MYCRHCGSEVDKNAAYCMNCGKKPLNGSEHCYNCSAETTDDQEICLKCGVNLTAIKISESDTATDMYCRHCGSEVDKNAEYCMTCGRRPLVGTEFCQNCGSETSENQEICIKCGVHLQDATNLKGTEANQLNSAGLSGYYQDEFQKMRDSNGAYKGKMNWAAFFFGTFWLFFKGMWQMGLILFVLTSITSLSYVIPFIIWVFLGMRGNYLYYRFREHNEVFPDFKDLFSP